MVSFRHRARLLAQRFGVDLLHYPQSDPLWRLTRLLDQFHVDVVLDVGANDGGFASSIRRHGYRGRLHSFEPIPYVYQLLQAKASGDAAWETHDLAIGDQDCSVSINVAGNSAASSSILPMLDRHREAAPSSAYIRSESVSQRTLDGLTQSLRISDQDRAFLKIDVQGYERFVLAGAPNLMAQNVAGLQVELSLVPLYERGMTWEEGLSRMKSAGMTLMGVAPGFTDPTGQMLQVDAVFFRTPLGAVNC